VYSPTSITPWLKVNSGAWTSTTSATVAAGGTVVIGPQPVSGGSWSWIGPNNFTSTNREITLSGINTSQAGTYSVMYTNAAGCKSTKVFVVTVTGGVISSIKGDLILITELDEEQENTALIAYPNPVENKVTITVPVGFAGADIVLLNLYGTVLYKGKATKSGTSIDMGQMPQGIYIAEIILNNEVQCIKILKK
jgi:xyloglucan-specific exo-beta-1,4-glucanase